ncbi:SMP-30/Gluconolaconase/LRE-like region [Phlyctema vagabunda]|uniref:SMP-30/Gluconolaconase/LRE-like region n=1 Tax=Phlyctema vagabunda TaxID=108571 RepID=A0ABR4PN44_9HELO
MASTMLKQALSLALVSKGFALSSNVFRFTPDAVADVSLLNTFTSDNATSAQFHVFDDSFLPILGENPTLSIIVNSSNSSFPQFHEAAVVQSSDPPVLFVTSNQYNFTGIDSPDTSQKTVAISRVTQDATSQQWSAEIITPAGAAVRLANGGTLDKDGSVIICAQGDLKNGGGLLRISPSAPFTATNLINSYFGIPFNSPNDVVRTKDGALWMTDPQFGFLQDIRPAAQLPPHIYRWVPGTNDLRVAADGLQAPNGIAFSPDERIAYITDTAKSTDAPTAPSAIYAFDVIITNDQPVLANKRTFAMPTSGIPDGIKTDTAGNVYSGCGDGVNVWSPAGLLMGKIIVPGGAANFALGPNGMVFLLNEDKLWLATLPGLQIAAS